MFAKKKFLTVAFVFVIGLSTIAMTKPSTVYSPALNACIPFAVRVGNVRATASVDLDGDGIDDLAVGNAKAGGGTTPNITIWKGGSGIFTGSYIEQNVGFVEGLPQAIIAADFDNDGDLDLVVGTGNSSLANDTIHIFINDGTPFSGQWPMHAVSGYTNGVDSMVSADIDMDGNLDIIVGFLSIGPWILENDGTPFDDTWEHHTLSTYPSGPTVRSIHVLDYENDGDLDILTNGTTVEIFMNDGTPFNDNWWYSDAIIGSFSTSGGALGSLDSDNVPDFVKNNSKDIYIAHNQGRVWNEPGNALWDIYNIGSDSGGGIKHIGLADLNGDTNLDIIVSSREDGTAELIMFINPGYPWGGNWIQYDIVEWDSHIESFSTGDFDGDGDIDILFGSRKNAAVEVGLCENISQ